MQINATGLRCPMPVLKLQKVIRGLKSGTHIVLMATDPMSYVDIRHFCETNGHELLNAQETDNIFTYKIKVGNQREAEI